MLKTFEILLDIEKDLYSPANILFTVSRNDFESIELLFTIMQDEMPVDLTGQTVELAIKKPSGLVVYQDVEITDAAAGKAAARLSIQAYVEFGLHTAEVYIRDIGSMAVSTPFYFVSRESIMQAEDIESVNDWSALQKALFAYDLKPILVDGVPENVVPEYIGQMAFDIRNKRAFIANDVLVTGWQLFASGEGGTGGGLIYWADIIGKPAAYPPEIHTHDFVDITGKPATYPPDPHAHAITDVTGLQAALDGKQDAGEASAPVDHTHAIADVTGLQTALDGKADDADLIPFITETEADAKYAIKGETGGTIAAAWGDIAGTLANQTDLQAALDAKADDADLTGKADAVHTHAITDVTGLQLALDGKADDADLTGKADVNHTHTFAAITEKPAAYPPEAHDHTIANVTGLQLALDGKADDADLTGKADVNHNHAILDVTGLQAALDGKADDADLTGKADVNHNHAILDVTGLQAALDGKADDADLTGKADVNHTHTFATITEKPAAYPAEAHNHAILDVTGLQAALDGKADDADLTGKADAVHSHAIADVTGLTAALDGKADDADLTTKADVNHNHDDSYLKLTGGTITGAMTIANGADGAELLRLETERPWAFKQIGIGADADLILAPDTNSKTVIVQSPLGIDTLEVRVDDDPTRAYINSPNIKENGVALDEKYALKGEAGGTVDLTNYQEKADIVTDLPATAPRYAGQMAVDATGGRTFIANGTTAADWERLADTTYVDTADNYILNTVLEGNKVWTGTQAEYDAIATKDPATIYHIIGGIGNNGSWTGTQAEYDAITTKNPNTLYFITAG